MKINEMALFPLVGANGQYTTDFEYKEKDPTNSDYREVLPTDSFKVEPFVKHGIKVYPAYSFNKKIKAPDGFKTALRHAVKDVNNENNYSSMMQLIGRKLKYIKVNGMFNDIDIIIPLGSKSKLNELLSEEIKKICPKNPLILKDVLQKNKWKDVEVVDIGEKSKEGYNMALRRLLHMQSTNPNEDFEIKKTGKSQSVRRYFKMFYKINSTTQVDLLKVLPNSNILLVDDTYEEGVTIKEVHRLIESFNPKSIKAFVFLSGN